MLINLATVASRTLSLSSKCNFFESAAVQWSQNVAHNIGCFSYCRTFDSIIIMCLQCGRSLDTKFPGLGFLIFSVFVDLPASEVVICYLCSVLPHVDPLALVSACGQSNGLGMSPKFKVAHC